MTVVTLTTVLQFHHHDCDGNIYIHLTTLDDLSLGSSHHGIEHCQHHNHDKNQHDCDGGKDCSMHLGAFTVSKQSECKFCPHHHDSSTNHVDLFTWINPIYDQIDFKPTEFILNKYQSSNKTLLISELIANTIPFRAPPTAIA